MLVPIEKVHNYFFTHQGIVTRRDPAYAQSSQSGWLRHHTQVNGAVVVVGEGEQTMLELVEALAGRGREGVHALDGVDGLVFSNDSGEGSDSNPWKTIGFAMEPLSRYSDIHPATIVARPGLYEERILFAPNVHVQGSGSDVTFVSPSKSPDVRHRSMNAKYVLREFFEAYDSILVVIVLQQFVKRRVFWAQSGFT